MRIQAAHRGREVSHNSTDEQGSADVPEPRSVDPDRHELWFTRRNGIISGPHPGRLIARYLILGRLAPDDEVSPDQHYWVRIQERPHLIPDELRHADTPEGRTRLEQARMREDERLRERRSNSPEEIAKWQEKRQGERRQPESPEIVSHRAQWSDLLQRPRQSLERRMRGPMPWLIVAGTVLIALLLVWLVPEPEDPTPDPDCSLAPAPGVNWSRCDLIGADLRGVDLRGATLRDAEMPGARLDGAHLAGADLSYARLRQARLTDADLAGATLVGTGLQHADLSGANLAEADLSYADLGQARIDQADLSGTILDRAIWRDGRICASGSVGRCE